MHRWFVIAASSQLFVLNDPKKHRFYFDDDDDGYLNSIYSIESSRIDKLPFCNNNDSNNNKKGKENMLAILNRPRSAISTENPNVSVWIMFLNNREIRIYDL